LKKLNKIGDINFINDKMFDLIKLEKRKSVGQKKEEVIRQTPAFDKNELYKKLKNNNDVKKSIYDYYKLRMDYEVDVESGKIKKEGDSSKEKFGPNLYLYIVIGFLGTALSFELANLNNVRQAMLN